MKELNVKVTFKEPILGTLAGDPAIAMAFILSKHPEIQAKIKELIAGGKATDELQALNLMVEGKAGEVPDDELEIIQHIKETGDRASTIFPKDDGKAFLWDYQVKGFFKDATLALATAGDYTQEDLKKLRITMYMYKRTIDHHLFISPRKIFFTYTGEITWNERPLRADTMKGERIALARSEQVPAGATIDFTVTLLNEKLEDHAKKVLDYGKFRGIGQWRNSGMGSFTYKLA